MSFVRRERAAASTRARAQVAIKVLDKERIQKQSMGSQIKKEISIMKQLEHPNVRRGAPRLVWRDRSIDRSSARRVAS